MKKDRKRGGLFTEILEARISELEYRQLDVIAKHLNTTKAGLIRFMIENEVWEKYGDKAAV